MMLAEWIGVVRFYVRTLTRRLQVLLMKRKGHMYVY